MKEKAKKLLQVFCTVMFWMLPINILVTLGILTAKTATEEIKYDLKQF